MISGKTNTVVLDGGKVGFLNEGNECWLEVSVPSADIPGAMSVMTVRLTKDQLAELLAVMTSE